MTTTHKDPRAVIEQPVTIVERYALRPRWVTSRGMGAHKADDALTAGREALGQTQGEAVDGNILLQAIARGWCSEKNSGKIMDPILALAIRDEVQKLYTNPQASEPVGINGLTEAETSASMSVRGLSAPIVGLQSVHDAITDDPSLCDPAPSTAGEPRPVYGKPGTRDIDVAEAMKRWDAAHAQPAQGERAEYLPLSAIRAIAVEAIRAVTGCPDIKGNGKYLVNEIEDVAKHAAADDDCHIAAARTQPERDRQ